MQTTDGNTKLVERAVGEIPRLGREEAEAVVAPIVAQALLQQRAVLDEGMDRQQFHRRNAQAAQMVDEHGVAQGGEGAPLVGPQILAHLADTPDMGLVDHHVRPGHRGRPVVGPVEALIGHHALHDAGRTVAPIEGQVGPRRVHPIAVECVGVAHLAGETAGIGVEQQFVGIEPMARLRLVGTMRAVAVDQARPGIRQVPVPDLVGAFRQVEACDLPSARGIEEA